MSDLREREPRQPRLTLRGRLQPRLPCAVSLITAAAVLAALSANAADPPSPAAAPAPRFYVVQPDGKSRPDDPVRSGFGIAPDPQLSGSGYPPRDDIRRTSPPEAPGAVRIRINQTSSPPPRDEFAADRCQRLGFFYTADGRCVAPAGSDRPEYRRPAREPSRAPVLQ